MKLFASQWPGEAWKVAEFTRSGMPGVLVGAFCTAGVMYHGETGAARSGSYDMRMIYEHVDYPVVFCSVLT